MCNCAVAIVEVLLFATALCLTDQLLDHDKLLQLTEFNVCCNIVDLPKDFQFSRWKLVKCYITGVCRLDQLHKLTVRKLIRTIAVQVRIKRVIALTTL